MSTPQDDASDNASDDEREGYPDLPPIDEQPTAPQDAIRIALDSIVLGGGALGGASTAGIRVNLRSDPSYASTGRYATGGMTSGVMSAPPPPPPIIYVQLFLPGHREYLAGPWRLDAPLEILRRRAMQVWQLVDDVEVHYAFWGAPTLELVKQAQQMGMIAFARRYGSMLVDLTSCETFTQAVARMEPPTREWAEARAATPSTAAMTNTARLRYPGAPPWLTLLIMRAPTGATRTAGPMFAIENIIEYAEALLEHDPHDQEQHPFY